jgi:hypothetical protein
MCFHEVDHTVEEFVEHPITYRYRGIDGRIHRHPPDLFLLRNGVPWFQEHKYEAEASLPENEARWPLIGCTLSDLGFGYEVITEHHIRALPRADNIKAFFRERHTVVSDDCLSLVRGAMMGSQRSQVRTIRGLMEQIPDLTYERALLLILRGFLQVNLDLLLSAESEIAEGRALGQWSSTRLPKRRLQTQDGDPSA